MQLKLNRAMVINCLRLIIACLVVYHYYGHLANFFEYFKNEVQPHAKSCFLFAMPQSSTGESFVSDFPTFYAAGLLNKERLEKNLHIDIYDPYLFTQAIERVIAPMQPQGTYCIQYPPMFFALVTPLAYFDLYTAWRIWLFVSVISVIIAYICIAYKSIRKNPLLLAGLFICLINFPVTQGFILGQTTALEAALLAISFRFLIDKKYFWAGVVAAISLLKLQQALIVLIPGFCIGRKKFSQGFFLMLALEFLLSIPIVGFDNLTGFMRTNYMAEIAHSFNDMNELRYYITFGGMLQCLPWFIFSADRIAKAVYIFVLLFVLGLWLRVYPALQKISNQAIELVASVSTIALVVFSLHGYWYDHLLFLFPCLWLYIWSSTNETCYTLSQSIARLIISFIVFLVPFWYWDNILMAFNENSVTGWQIRMFLMGVVLLACGLAAILIECKMHYRKGFVLAN